MDFLSKPFEDKFSNISEQNSKITAFYRTNNVNPNDDEREVNLLRHSILTRVNTYAIDYVKFDSKMRAAALIDEQIANRLGQCSIQADIVENVLNGTTPTIGEILEGGKWKIPFNIGSKAEHDYYEFTTEDIPEVPFVDITPITLVNPGEKFYGHVIIGKANGDYYVTHRPATHFSFSKTDGGFIISMTSFGMLPAKRLLREGYAAMSEVMAKTDYNMYFTPSFPGN